LDSNPYRSPTGEPARNDAAAPRPQQKQPSIIVALLKGAGLGAGLGVLASLLAGIVAIWISWEHMSPEGEYNGVLPLLAVAFFALMMSVVTAPLGAVVGGIGWGVIPLLRRPAKMDATGDTPPPHSDVDIQ